MLQLFYSNRYEVLAQALLDDLTAGPGEPWSAVPIVVPSAALQRRLTLDIANRFGICANVRFCYLAQWLWEQIGRVVPVPEHSPFAPDRLVWRCYRLLDPATWAPGSARLDTYLRAADPAMRYELARRVAVLFDHYLTYRPDWLLQWQQGGSLFAPDAAERDTVRTAHEAPDASEDNLAGLTARRPAGAGVGEPCLLGTGPGGVPAAARADERWQAELWRLLLAELTSSAPPPAPALVARADAGRPRRGARADPLAGQPPAYRFLSAAADFDFDTVARAAWPARISVFALPTMPPLHVALLRELARWIDVHIYVLNPCREFWLDIVTGARAEDLEAQGKRDYQEVGNSLLAEWGRQTQAQMHMLSELTEGFAAGDASRYVHNPAPTWLAALQNAVLDLHELPALDAGRSPPAGDAAAAGIEVHVCHSLSRQLEVLHDRLLDLFASQPDLEPAEVLIALPDLAGAAPLIDAVFGAAAPGDARRIPYRISGLPVSAANPLARALLDLLTLAQRRVGAPELVEWLRVDALATRYGIDAAALETIQEWLAAAGARRGLSPADPARLAPGEAPARHTFADALTRLYLGYALPDGGDPVDDWLPVAGANGGDAELLGRLTRFVDDLDEFATACGEPRPVAAWRTLLVDVLGRLFDPGMAYADALAQVRDGLDALLEALESGASSTPIPAIVLKTALAGWFDDPARGGVPSGGVTFSALSSLRGLPYRVIGIFGMDDGVLPSRGRPDEFDLMAAFGRPGDRQRRDDERNLFFDLVLAARERLLIGYTGRSIRDNAPLPPATLVDELLDYLGKASAGHGAAPDELSAARAAFVIEHPLQPFARAYFETSVETGAGANGSASAGAAVGASVGLGGPFYTYESSRLEVARSLAEPARMAGGAHALGEPFFAAALPPEDLAESRAAAAPHAAGSATEAAGLVDFIHFERFWRHPLRALLRDRLGIRLVDAPPALSEAEPHEIDYAARDVLAQRLLPVLLPSLPGSALHEYEMQAYEGQAYEGPAVIRRGGGGSGPGQGQELRYARAARIASASPEFPGAATGAIWRQREVGALTRLASGVREALAAGTGSLPFELRLQPAWPHAMTPSPMLRADAPLLEAACRPLVLAGVLHGVTADGLVMYRYAKPGARDYLAAWLRHLVWCAAFPDSGQRTLWLGDGERFVLGPVADAGVRLAELLALYRVGRCMPLRFFPRSAWQLVKAGEAAAQAAWRSDRYRGDAEDPAVTMALRGRELLFDNEARELAHAVFDPLLAHLVDEESA